MLKSIKRIPEVYTTHKLFSICSYFIWLIFLVLMARKYYSSEPEKIWKKIKKVFKKKNILEIYYLYLLSSSTIYLCLFIPLLHIYYRIKGHKVPMPRNFTTPPDYTTKKKHD